MAERKNVDLGPHTDGGVTEYEVQSSAMAEQAFNTVIRFIKRGQVGSVDQFREVVENNVKRLRVKLGRRSPVEGIPDGSDQVDVQSLVQWANKIQPNDRKASIQLGTIAATIGGRFA